MNFFLGSEKGGRVNAFFAFILPQHPNTFLPSGCGRFFFVVSLLVIGLATLSRFPRIPAHAGVISPMETTSSLLLELGADFPEEHGIALI